MKKLALQMILLGLMISITSSDLTAQTRISFARGRTSATVSSSINAYANRSFVLTARYGQVLSANISSRNGCVKFSNGATSISYITQPGNNYLEVVNNCRTATGFNLTVSINYGSD